MDLTEENIRIYLRLCSTDLALAMDMWKTLEMEAKDLIGFMQREMGIRLEDMDPDMIVADEPNLEAL